MTIKLFLTIILISIETKDEEILNDRKLKLLIKDIFFLQFLLALIDVKFLALLPLFAIINTVYLFICLSEYDIFRVWDEVIMLLKSQKTTSKYLAIIMCVMWLIQVMWEKFN